MKISVVCPVYNTKPALLEAAVGSVLDQAGADDVELILVDDSSTDGATLDFLGSLGGDARVRLLRQAPNGGPAQARNFGVAQARHGWIGFIDADDLWPAGKLAGAAGVLAAAADAGWIGGNYATLGEDGRIVPYQTLTAKVGGVAMAEGVTRLRTPDLTRVLVADWLPLGASLIRRDLFDRAGRLDTRLRYGEDWLFNLRLSMLCPLDYGESATYVLRRQGASMMRSAGRMSRAFLRACRVARQDRRLGVVGKQLRWKLYADYKDVAMNNAINRAPGKGMVYALGALAVDPREWGELMLFMRALTMAGVERRAVLRGYSTAEQVVLADLR